MDHSAIIAAVLVVIVSLIAFFPAMLINGMAKEQVKRLDNSYINSNYQGWNEVTFLMHITFAAGHMAHRVNQ